MGAVDGATRVPSVVAWVILLVLLVGLYRFTAIGLDRVPDRIACTALDCGGSPVAALARVGRSPRHLLVGVRVQGRALPFLLDTGAASTVMATSAARDTGLLAATRPILGAVNDRFGVQHVLHVDELVVAGHAFGHFDVAVIGMAGIREALGPQVAGVLGADVLGQQPFEIDFVAPALVLGRPPEAFVRTRAPGESDTEVAVTDLGGGWFVRAQADDREGFFLVDSGSNVSQISDALAAEIGGSVESRGRVFDATGSAAAVRTTRLGLLALGDVGRRDFVVAVGDASLLGADFFDGMLLRVDAGASRLTVRRSTRPPGASPAAGRVGPAAAPPGAGGR